MCAGGVHDTACLWRTQARTERGIVVHERAPVQSKQHGSSAQASASDTLYGVHARRTQQQKRRTTDIQKGLLSKLSDRHIVLVLCWSIMHCSSMVLPND